MSLRRAPRRASSRAGRPGKDRAAALSWARTVLSIEARAIDGAAGLLGEGFLAAVDLLEGAAGRVVVTGIGKPGFIARKLSATLASVGRSSFYLHPAEALHGDLGRLERDDVVVALSNSGASEELLRLVVPLRRLACPLVVLTGAPRSPLARAAAVVVDIGTVDEACPLGLVPTASSAAMHAVADALAMTLAWRRGVTAEEYAFFHPGGQLGRRALKVEEVMRTGAATPVVPRTASLQEVVVVMTNTPGRPGAALVVDGEGMLVGIFTDGDLRRLAERKKLRLSTPVSAVMAARPVCVGPDELVLAAAERMREASVDQLPVVDGAGRAVGLIDVQDVLAARVL